MFELFYFGYILDVINKHPRESAACIAAIVIIPGMHKRHTEVQMAKIRSANDVEVARLEKEAAELKYKTAKLYAVENPSTP